MDKVTTLYDLHVTPDSPVIISSWVLIALCVFLSIVNLNHLNSRKKWKNRENIKYIFLATVGIIGGTYVSCNEMSRIYEIIKIRQDYNAGKYRVYDGCIKDLEILPCGHGCEKAKFSVSGERFEINGQETNIGYKTVHHYDFPNGEPISENAHLRILASRGHMLRIETFEKACSVH